MGEIADGLINGDFDFYTGEYIGNGGGFPRTKDKSLDWERSETKDYTNASTKNKFYGLVNWLNANRYNSITTSKKPKQIIRQYAIEVIKLGQCASQDEVAVAVSGEFSSFKQWVISTFGKPNK